MSAVQDLLAPLASVTVSEDPASSLQAIVEFEANTADLARVEVYRSVDGSGHTVIGYDTGGRSVALFLDVDGRPFGALADDGTRFEIRYPSGAVEVSVTYPDGTTDSETMPLQAGLFRALAQVPARLAEFSEGNPRVEYPRNVYSTGFVRVETTRADGKPVPPEAVEYSDATCVSSDPDVQCEARVGAIKTLGRVSVTATVAVPEAMQGSGQIWRTRADCETLKAGELFLYKGGGTAVATTALVFGIMRARTSPAGQAATRTLAAAVMYASFLIGQGLSWLPWLRAEDCAKSPNLEKIRDAVLDEKVLSALTVSVRAKPVKLCAQSTVDGLRIKDPVGKATLTPFVRRYRSDTPVFTASGQSSDQKLMGVIGISAKACPIEMTGSFDLASLASGSGLGSGGLAAFKKLIGENTVKLSIDPGEVPGDPGTATGDYAFSIVLPDEVLWGIQSGIGETLTGSGSKMPADWSGCTMTDLMSGTLSGKVVQKGETISVQGTSKLTSKVTLDGCWATSLKASPPQSFPGVKWSFKGDTTNLKGTLVIPDPEDSSKSTLKITLKAK
jgi:hypothetical protein